MRLNAADQFQELKNSTSNNLKREVILTDDGSTTIKIHGWEETYHSKYGAIQEAYHVFIKNGLSRFNGQPVSILEIGFGTGLNAFITYLNSEKLSQQINYVGVEAFPISQEELSGLNYVDVLNAEAERAVFDAMHNCDWETKTSLSSLFTLTKTATHFQDIAFQNKFDIIYFDAFGYGVQPELWSEEIFALMYSALKKSGLLITYAARSIIKRNMQSAGFTVKKLEGPPGKREMMAAFKNFHEDV